VVTSVKIPAGNQRAISAQGRLRTILRPGGQAEPAEVGVLLVLFPGRSQAISLRRSYSDSCKHGADDSIKW
jgi:hypothetical protein